jgi:HK97 family phage portal protein
MEEFKDRQYSVDSVKELNFGDISQEAGNGQWEQEINAFIEGRTLKSLFFNEDWVYLCVDLVAEHCSTSPLVIKQEVFREDELVTEKVDSHPLYSLFQRPNPFQDYYSWQYNAFVEILLMGNTIEWVNEKNSIVIVIPSETVALDFDSGGQLEAYLVNRDTDVSQMPSSIARFDREEIFHQMRPNPSSMLWGLSPFIANRKAILNNRYTADYINSFYLRGATPGMVLTMDKVSSPESALRFLRSFEVANTGRRNNRRTLVLPKGVTADVVTPTMADQQILQITESNQNKILASLKVPKHAFSLAESGSLGSEEHKQALKFFYKSAVIPAQRKRAGYLTMKWRERGVLEPNQFIEFDNSSIDVMQDDMGKKAELGSSLLDQWTLNEIRLEVWEKPPIEGGDIVVGAQPAAPALPPLNFNLPGTQGQVAGVTDAAEPVKDDEATDYRPDEKVLSERARNKAAFVSKYKDHFEFSKKQLDTEVDKKEDSILEIILDLFAGQLEKAILPLVEDELDKLPGRKQEKAAQNPTKIPAKLNKRLLKKRLEKSLEDFTESTPTLDRYVDELNPTVTRSYGVMVNPAFDPDRVAALQALQQEDTEGRRATLAARGLDTFAKVNETTTKKVMGIIDQGVKDRKTILEIRKDIADKVKDLSVGRATTIARTEVLTAVSLGKAAAMKDMEKVFEDEPLVKLWLTAGDDRVRDTHIDLDGEAIPVGDTFDNGLDYPRDPSGEAAEVINCRCDMSVVPAKDLGLIETDQPSEFADE